MTAEIRLGTVPEFLFPGDAERYACNVDTYSPNDADCQRCVRDLRAKAGNDAVTVALGPFEVVLKAIAGSSDGDGGDDDGDGDGEQSGVEWQNKQRDDNAPRQRIDIRAVIRDVRAGRPDCAAKCSMAKEIRDWTLDGVLANIGNSIPRVFKRGVGGVVSWLAGMKVNGEDEEGGS